MHIIKGLLTGCNQLTTLQGWVFFYRLYSNIPTFQIEMSENDPPNNENNNPDPIVDIDEDKRCEENFSSCSSRTSSNLSRSITRPTLNNSNQFIGSRFVANNFSSAGCRSNVNLLSQNSLSNLNVISQSSLDGSKGGDFCVSGLSL